MPFPKICIDIVEGPPFVEHFRGNLHFPHLSDRSDSSQVLGVIIFLSFGVFHIFLFVPLSPLAVDAQASCSHCRWMGQCQPFKAVHVPEGCGPVGGILNGSTSLIGGLEHWFSMG